MGSPEASAPPPGLRGGIFGFEGGHRAAFECDSGQAGVAASSVCTSPGAQHAACPARRLRRRPGIGQQPLSAWAPSRPQGTENAAQMR